MGITRFPNGVSSYGIPMVGGVPFGKDSRAFFVDPVDGSDGNRGTDKDAPYKTLATAHGACTAGRNDVVFLMSRSNSASATTDYQSATLTWSKDATHLVGIGAGTNVGQRARIAQLSTATGVAPLVTISGNNCLWSGVHVFHGVADATSIGAVNVTGQRNHFVGCHFAGIGHNDMDSANNYSLQLSGGAENLFEGCTIGLDTIARGTAANSELRLVSGAVRNTFRECLFPTYAEASGHQFILVPTNGLDRWNLFDRCLFVNMPTGTASGTTMTEAFDVTGGGSPDGLLVLKECSLIGATDWEAATVSGKVQIDGGTPSATLTGLGVVVAAS